MVARADTGRQFQHAKYRAVVQGRPGGAQTLVFTAVIVDREALGRPHDARGGARPPRGKVLCHLIDPDDGSPGLVMTGNDAAKFQRHMDLLARWTASSQI